MQATLTDVQKAIEQLGHSGGDAASFSFASSHGDYTDRETETDVGDSEDEAATDWHRSTRERLAERARQENEERQAREGQSSVPTTPLRVTAPPIDVEVSDESDEEEEIETRISPKRRSGISPEKRYSSPYAPLPEEDEAVDEANIPLPTSPPATQTAAEPDRADTIIPSLPSAALTPPSAVPAPAESDAGHIEPSEDFIVPSPSAPKAKEEPEDEPPTATADRLTFPDMPLTNSPDPSSLPSTAPNTNTMPTPIPPAAPSPVLIPEPPPPAITHAPVMPGSLNPLSPVSPENAPTLPTAAAAAPSIRSVTAPTITTTPAAIKVHEPTPTPFFSRSTAPSPGRASIPSPGLPMPSPSASSTGSVGFGSQSGIQQTLTPATTMSFKTAGQTPQQELSPTGSQDGHKRPATHPSEWSLEEVIEWLKAKGFDQGVCDKFIGE